MTNRVIHQEYLEAWLSGESLDSSYKDGDWKYFDYNNYSLDVFNSEDHKFRITPKVIEVNLTDFYAEYSNTTGLEVSYERGYDELVTLIKKYLPRGDL